MTVPSIMAAPSCRFFRHVKIILTKSRFLGSRTLVRCLNSTTGNQTERHQGKETHFGFDYIPEEEKEQRVHDVFENVADKYDLMNDAMSVGVHRLWKDCFVKRLGPVPGTKLIDVAGGTGDIAFRCLDYSKAGEEEYSDNRDWETESDTFNSNDQYSQSDSPESVHTANQSTKEKIHRLQTHVTISDINQAMLDVGKKKASERGFFEGRDLSWLCANAECLPVADNTYDGYTIAFGIRNVTHINKVLEEAYRVLKPGGRFMCLEFSTVENPILRKLYDSYSFQVIPVMGQVIARDWNSYQYLVESIRQFPDQRAFAAMIEDAGFRMVTYENLTFGVAAIHSGFKL